MSLPPETLFVETRSRRENGRRKRIMNEFIQLFKRLQINSGTNHSRAREARVVIAKK